VGGILRPDVYALGRPPVREFAHKLTTADDAHQATEALAQG
jgi:hypothetical protein